MVLANGRESSTGNDSKSKSAKQENSSHLSPFFIPMGPSYCRLGATENDEEVIMGDTFILPLTRNIGPLP